MPPRLLPPALLLLLLASCGRLGCVKPLNLQEIRDLRLVSVGEDGLHMETLVALSNPNRLDGKVRDARYEFYADGRLLGTGTVPGPFETPGGADLEQWLPFDMPWSVVDAQTLELLERGEVPYRTEIDARLITPLGDATLSLTSTGRMTLPKQVRADAVWGLARQFLRIRDVRAAGPPLAPLARMAGSVAIRNPLPVPMRVRGATYTIASGDRTLASGRIDGPKTVPAGGEAALPFHSDVDQALSGGVLLGSLLERSLPKLRLHGELAIEPLGGFESFPFDFTLRAGDLLPR